MLFLGTTRGTEIDIDLDHIPSSQIQLQDLANALSNLCRFGGHVREFYSVAEHSVRVSRYLSDKGSPLHVVRQGLMHDAHEAICGDMPSPTKKVLGQVWKDFETKCEVAVRTRFGIQLGMYEEVHNADLHICSAEHRDLRAPHTRPWTLGSGSGYPTIVPWSPEVAFNAFMDECGRLGLPQTPYYSELHGK